MGDISEAMMDGTLCDQCGVFIREPCGHPRTCADCLADDDDDDDAVCSDCGWAYDDNDECGCDDLDDE